MIEREHSTAARDSTAKTYSVTCARGRVWSVNLFRRANVYCRTGGAR